jgi:hypothetical protein
MVSIHFRDVGLVLVLGISFVEGRCALPPLGGTFVPFYFPWGTLKKKKKIFYW